ncbi:ferritin-like protein [uncultured Rhodoblastus sp.]|uniref:ferritin-like domain-containing protein n=1 Tax=uncultured Rhodoblastus sp. TaxID=543037 RepID=UPI0025E310BC|nr:ferritin-like protein [uncultured Rhodoblastus sp.]
MASPDITSIEVLRSQLAKAIQLEHATIPPYLTALYSIRPGANTDATQILRVIVVEEMLHLTISANLLNAIGGKPDLTVKGFVPSYPATLPDGETDFTVGVGPLSPETLKAFLKIERPAMAPAGKSRHVVRKSDDHSTHLCTLPEDATLRYYSIGEFYAAIRDAIVYLDQQAKAKGETIFTGDPKRQVTSEYYYSGGGKLWPIVDPASAAKAIDLVIQQGEGKTQAIFGDSGEIAHYYRFLQLDKNRYYQQGDSPENPTGPALTTDWSAVWPIATNLKLAALPAGSELYDAAVAFNSAYRQFLALLTRAYNGEPQVLLDAVPRMFEFRNLIQQLICNPLPGGNGNAAPTYEI